MIIMGSTIMAGMAMIGMVMIVVTMVVVAMMGMCHGRILHAPKFCSKRGRAWVRNGRADRPRFGLLLKPPGD